ncbi:hypothetical protein XBJ1_2240 [Xenorhabdus bovienii SS-2004]|uniref:Uncharacterized protein n=1 Tax=Xenorhabdus bovienii (strain SS-2004) TaxID=406818 RepID=D3V216_XENBS|nr:hypothetical protein XBJ1_2240 [Xenorhabdus bovienii SS-2004]
MELLWFPLFSRPEPDGEHEGRFVGKALSDLSETQAVPVETILTE